MLKDLVYVLDYYKIYYTVHDELHASRISIKNLLIFLDAPHEDYYLDSSGSLLHRIKTGLQGYHSAKKT